MRITLNKRILALALSIIMVPVLLEIFHMALYSDQNNEISGEGSNIFLRENIFLYGILYDPHRIAYAGYVFRRTSYSNCLTAPA